MTNIRKNAGFTLIEIMTSVSVFAIVMTISMGSIIGVFNTNKKSEALRAVMDNLNLSLESIAREMRFGSVYYSCGTSPDFVSPQNCSSGDSFVAFVASNGEHIIYKQTGSRIDKSVAGGSFVPVTADEIVIDDLSFYVLGTSSGDGLQPKVLIKIKGTAGVKENGVDRTDFTVQTLVSQRFLDQ